MKLGVISDSHDNLDAIALALNVFEKEDVEAILHAGDITSPFTARALGNAGKKVYAVFGNCDGEKLGLKQAFSEIGGEICEDLIDYEFDGRSIFMTHKDSIAIPVSASGHFDIVIYGHTHRHVVKKVKDKLLLNPGELSGWVTHQKTLAILDLDKLDAKIVKL